MFEYPKEIRKIIYTTNPIESLNSALRKVTRRKGSFINEMALMKVLYLRVENLEKKRNEVKKVKTGEMYKSTKSVGNII